MSNAWKGGSTRRWRAIRDGVLEENRVRNGGQCQAQCIGLCARDATHVHHTMGRQVTGDDPRFLVAVCGPCNVHIGDPQRHPVACPACVRVPFGPHAAGSRAAQQPTLVTRW